MNISPVTVLTLAKATTGNKYLFRLHATIKRG